MNALRRGGIHFDQVGVECRCASATALVVEPASKLRIGTRSRKAEEKGLQVQHGTADQHRVTTAVADLRDAGVGALDIALHIERLVRFDDIDEVMGHVAPGPRRGLCGPDIHPPIDLHGIEGQDLCTEPRGDTKGEAFFSRCRRPDDAEQRRQPVVAPSLRILRARRRSAHRARGCGKGPRPRPASPHRPDPPWRILHPEGEAPRRNGNQGRPRPGRIRERPRDRST